MNPASSQLLNIANRDRIAFVGVAKNCGKTTTLTSLLRLRDDERDLPALVSIGVDGEAEDALLGTKKPPIHVEPDQWIATADSALRQCTARVEYAESPGIDTPAGRIYICRVLDAGTIKLAGLRRHSELIRTIGLLRELGAGPVWVDGAYGRLMAAHPELSDAVVVATGAVAADNVDDVVSKTAHLVDRLQLPPITDDTFGDAIDRAVADDRPFVVDTSGDIHPLATRSAVAGITDALEAFDHIDAIAIPGLVSNRVAEQLLAFGEATLLVPDPTVLHPDPTLFNSLHNRWQIRVLHPITPLAVSYNPTAPDGNGFNARSLHESLKQRFDDLVVFDPCRIDG